MLADLDWSWHWLLPTVLPTGLQEGPEQLKALGSFLFKFHRFPHHREWVQCFLFCFIFTKGLTLTVEFLQAEGPNAAAVQPCPSGTVW